MGTLSSFKVVSVESTDYLTHYIVSLWLWCWQPSQSQNIEHSMSRLNDTLLNFFNIRLCDNTNVSGQSDNPGSTFVSHSPKSQDISLEIQYCPRGFVSQADISVESSLLQINPYKCTVHVGLKTS